MPPAGGILIFKEVNMKKLFVWFILLAGLAGAQRLPELLLITGTVLDAGSGRPIQSAVIEITGRNIFTTTNDKGFFSITPDTSFFRIKVTHVGYNQAYKEIDLSVKEDKEVVVYLTPKIIEISPVIVTDQHSHTVLEEINIDLGTLKGRELEKKLGITLGETLKNETGLAMRSMGPAPARPVIRGLGGDRVYFTEDGIKTSDLSATSPDHAVTIEPFSVERIEVIRGPKVLLNTPTTLGGVINVVRHDIPVNLHNNIFGSAGIYGETANSGLLGALNLQVPYHNLVFNGGYSRRDAADINSAKGVMVNSYARNQTWFGGVSYVFNNGYIGYGFRNFELVYGVPGGFVGAHPKGVDIDIRRDQYSVKGGMTFEPGFFEGIDFHAARSFYRHVESEKNGLTGSEFRIIDYTGQVQIHHEAGWIFGRGTLGIDVEARDFDIGGFVFSSPSTSFNLGISLFEPFTLGNAVFEAGVRYSYDVINPKEKKFSRKIGSIRERNFGNFSASLSGLYPVNEYFNVGFNLSKSSRVPTIEELFSEGPHLAAYSYEVGNPDLDSEGGYGAEVFAYARNGVFSYYGAAFIYDFYNYILPRNTGETNYQTFLPVYASSGVPVQLKGFEAQVEFVPGPDWRFRLNASYTNGEFSNDSRPMPQIPPLKGEFEAVYHYDIFEFGADAEYALSQERTDNFETPTAGYLVFGLFGHVHFATGKYFHSLALNLDNIFNTEYRNHLSRVKVILPEAGFNVRLIYKVFFDF